ncbi:hypothetical protein E4U53_006751 [Claviceps sorghi]|nr:hypothetical protein E4U53_006751 [Claviceps sorghi]
MLSLPTLGLAALVFAAGTTQAQTASSTGPTGGRACNNSPALCGRAYNAVTHMGAHNIAFLRDASTDNSLSGNQFLDATRALDAGLRLLQVQVHKPDTTLRLCHTSCSLLDAGALDAWLSAVNAWMVAHPHDVVTLLLVNADRAPASDLAAAFERARLSRLAYRPASNARPSTWPTLQSMIDADTRLVTLVTGMPYSASAPYLLPEFAHVFETPFAVTDLAGFNCTVDRPSRAGPAPSALAAGYMSLVNHFKYQSLVAGLDVPDVDAIDTVNSAASSSPGNLGRHLDQCRAAWNRPPTFVLVDFWNKGDVVAAADSMNRVTDATGRRDAVRQDDGDVSPGVALGRGGMGVSGAVVAFMCAVVVMM